MSQDMNTFQPGQPAGPQKKSSVGKIVLIILVILIVGAIACGGCCFFGWGWMMNQAGMQMVQPYADHPAVVEQLGGIDKAKLDPFATAERQKEGGEQVMVINVEGPNGSGQIELTGPQGNPTSATLVTSDGEWPLD